MRKNVGIVTESERDEIRQLYERINGLKELTKVVSPDNIELYEKLVTDMGTTVTRFQEWWNMKSNKYHWESSDEGSWEIDFDTCVIYLTESGRA
jgi:CXXX repeat modification system protein